MSYWFHGTTEENSATILKEGFRRGTFFGKHLEDAFHMGGDYVFWVWFDVDPTKYWEYVADEPIPAHKIMALLKIDKEVLYEDEHVQRRVRVQNFRERFGENAILCATCDGRGQMEKPGFFARWRDVAIVTSCPTCKGQGISNHKECCPDYYK